MNPTRNQLTESIPGQIDSLYSPKLIMAALISYSFLIIKYFIPLLNANEAIYLLPAKRLLDGALFQNDWLWSSAPRWESISIFFDALIAPLWVLFGDPVPIALLGRLVVWSFLVYAVFRLCQELRVRWWLLPAVFWFLVFVRGSFAADGWIFGGVEQKCFSYAFLILGLIALLQKKQLRGAVFCGLSIAFHVIVGGWGLVALLVAQVVLYKEYSFRGISKFGLLAICVGSPTIVLALRYLGLNEGGYGGEPSDLTAHQLITAFRAPHHMDPDHFLSWRLAARMVVAYLCTVFALFHATDWKRALFLVSFLSAVIAVFLVGLLASWQDANWFLVFYPFRLGGVFLWLLFCIGCAAYFSSRLTRRAQESQGLIKRLVPSLFFLALCLSVAAVGTLPSLGQKTFKMSVARFMSTWTSHFRGHKEPVEQVGEWIKKNTERDSVFIAPPCMHDFYIRTERAAVVCFKNAPHNKQIVEWYKRLEALNGSRGFEWVGFRACNQLHENYEKLRTDQLVDLKKRYGATFYLVSGPRPDLDDVLVYSNQRYYLYDLRGL